MISAVELDGMRTTSTSALPDACTITRPSTSLTLNTATMATVPGLAATIYTGACRLRAVDGQERDTEVASILETLGRYTLTLPYAADGIEVDDQVTITASDDADLVDQVLWVKQYMKK